MCACVYTSLYVYCVFEVLIDEPYIVEVGLTLLIRLNRPFCDFTLTFLCVCPVLLVIMMIIMTCCDDFTS